MKLPVLEQFDKIKKFCIHCKLEKDISEFHNDKNRKDGYHPYCKECCKLMRFEYTNSPINREKAKIRTKNWNKNNKERSKKYKEINKEKISKRMKLWRLNNKNRIKKYKKEYEKIRIDNNINYKLIVGLRKRLSSAIKNAIKVGSSVDDLGCTIEEFKLYIESKFQEGMTWDNWSRTGWHLDHILPLSMFDLSNPEEFKIAVHYTNLQPLWAKDNLKKGNRVEKC